MKTKISVKSRPPLFTALLGLCLACLVILSSTAFAQTGSYTSNIQDGIDFYDTHEEATPEEAQGTIYSMPVWVAPSLQYASAASGPYGAGALVTSATDLKSAVENTTNLYSFIDSSTGVRTRVVYLGANISLNSLTTGITVPSHIGRVIICGTHPSYGTKYTLTDWSGNSVVKAIQPSSSYQNITLIDMDIRGYNAYGIVYGSAKTGTIVHVFNVNYTGPCLTNNANDDNAVAVGGGTHTITGGASAREWIRGDRIQINNNITVNHNEGTASVIGIGPKFNQLNVTGGATLTVNTTQRLFSDNATARANAKLLIGGGLVLNLSGTGSNGVLWTTGGYCGTVDISNGARLLITAPATHSATPAVPVGSMRVAGICDITYKGGSGNTVNVIDALTTFTVGLYGNLSITQESGGAACIKAKDVTLGGTVNIEQLSGTRLIQANTLTVSNNAKVTMLKAAGSASTSTAVDLLNYFTIGTGAQVKITQQTGPNTLAVTNAGSQKSTVLGTLTINKIGSSTKQALAVGPMDIASTGAVIIEQTSGDHTMITTGALTVDGSLTIKKTGTATDVGLYTGNCVVNGTLDITMENGTSAIGPATALSKLAFMDGSTVTLNKTGGTDSAVIDFSKTSAINTFIIQYPKHVSINSTAGRLIAGGGATTLTVKTNAINLWAQEGKYAWNNNKAPRYEISAHIVGATTQVVQNTALTDGKGAMPGGSVMDPTTLRLCDPTVTRLLIAEFEPLTVDNFARGDASISGTAPGNCNLIGLEHYMLNSNTARVPALQATAGQPSAGGSYTVAMNQPLSLTQPTRPYVQAVRGDLDVYAHPENEPPRGAVWIDIPLPLVFQITQVLPDDAIIPRVDADWSITVHDTLSHYDESNSWVQTDWILQATMKDVFRSATNPQETLPYSYIAFMMHDYPVPLGIDLPLPIAQSSYAPGVQQWDLSWPEDEGFVLFQIGDEGKENEVYTTTIQWQLVLP